MSADEFNKLFARRLKYYMNEYKLTQKELAEKLNVGTTTVYNWCHGLKTPRMDKVDAMCRIFDCSRSDLIEENTKKPEYYLDKDARDAAEFLFNNPEYKVLFDASRKTKKEDIDFVAKMMNRMNGEEK